MLMNVKLKVGTYSIVGVLINKLNVIGLIYFTLHWTCIVLHKTLLVDFFGH